ncbi:glycosyltransferase [Terrilactibacillus laevilacticus]|uniref:Glycosyltransferase n=1 Tax=Terrilactibacillus laevilacticus TaxID=1380157 RepID=A0ABW5PQA4_9BACI|nr:glycosyltransferase [Terrilactibacillus laevilacticus]
MKVLNNDVLRELSFDNHTANEKIEDNTNDNLVETMISKFGISKIRLINDLLDPNVLTYLNIGRYDKQKGHDRLINAFEKYNIEFPNSRLIIIAPYGPIKKQTIQLVKNSPSKKNIYLFGRMNNPYALLKMVDAFVLSSYYEGLGLVVYEALALDKQVITVDIDTTMKYLKDNEVISVENTEIGLYNGLIAFHKGLRTMNKFNFDKYKERTTREFESLFD